MAKVFVSYKHRDNNVRQLPGAGLLIPTTGRSYVDELEKILANYEHVYKGERGDEDLRGFKDETIESQLRDQIFDSSVTLILISPGMQELGVPESEQWIPWEISYSLKTMSRGERTSLPNACVAIVLPDRNGSYEYFVQRLACGACTRWFNEGAFEMIGKNMFNRNAPNKTICSSAHETHTGEDHSYIVPVTWDEFRISPDLFIDRAKEMNKNIGDFDLKIQL